jgi:hypothetical protein
MSRKPAGDIALPDSDHPRGIACMPNHVHATLGRDSVQIEHLKVTVVAVVTALRPSN